MTGLVNAAGRCVPASVNGRPVVPYQGVGGHRPTGRRAGPLLRSCADYPADGDKRAPSLKEALVRAGLRDGCVISTHHHFRNGDRIAGQIFEAAAELGVRDLVWVPSAAFPVHASLIPLLESGVIHHIEGSLNGPLGAFASSGRMAGCAVLRSHGGRYRAIADGDLQIDIAVLGAPSSDVFGNANGVHGPSACGPLGFAMADCQFAEHVIVVTDNLVQFPCLPAAIAGNYVDQVVVVDQIGDPSEIVSGTTRVTRSPSRLRIARLAADFVEAAGILRDGFSFQAGAGGTSLAFTLAMAEKMRRHQTRAAFIRGGSTKSLVEMLQEGLTDAILDGQTFDLDGVKSLAENPRHVATSPFTSYTYHGKGHTASMLDVVVLGATEVDFEFNGNVATHSDGQMLHGLGGWQDALFARCTILTVPLFRHRVPVVRERVTTLCGPGELIDVVVTERGLAIHPRRADLIEAVKGSGLPIRTLEELAQEAWRLCGGPPRPAEVADETIGVIEWVDGTVIDQVRRVSMEGPGTELDWEVGG